MLKGQNRERFRKTLERLLLDVESMRADQAAVSAIGRGIARQFLHQARAALESDRLIRLIRVLEENKRVASLWYLNRCEPALVEQAFIDGGLDIGKLRQLSGQVKIVRDKVFVHMDKEAISDPEAIYKAAGINLTELGAAVECLWFVLNALHRSAFEEPYPPRPTTPQLRDLFES